jgi:hypothetical protein
MRIRFQYLIIIFLAQLQTLQIRLPDEVIGFFNWPNPFSRNMTMELTQPLREMSTKKLPGGKGWPGDNLAAICEPIVYKMWQPRSLRALWACTACCSDSFTFTLRHFPSSVVSLRMRRARTKESSRRSDESQHSNRQDVNLGFQAPEFSRRLWNVLQHLWKYERNEI